jgi:CheY-like chemotaxis protein
MSQHGSAILVADDEESIRSVLAEIIEGLGYEVVASADGAEVLEQLRHQAVCLALLDGTLPGLDGDLLREIRRAAPHLPLVLMSGYGQAELGQRAAVGVAGFLQKPFGPEDVAAILRSALALSHPS